MCDSKTPRSVSQRRIRLRAVLATFWIFGTFNSPTPRSVSQFWIFENNIKNQQMNPKFTGDADL